MEHLVRDVESLLIALAARVGEVEVLAWLRNEAGCEWDEGAPSCAASKGRLEALRWLHEHECPWDEEKC